MGELTYEQLRVDRAELCENLLDLMSKFEEKYPGAEIEAVRVERVDVSTIVKQATKLSRAEVSLVIT